MTRFFMSIGNLIFAFFLGALLLLFVAIQFPWHFQQILHFAAYVKLSINSYIPDSPSYIHFKNGYSYIIDEASLVLMFFVMLARIVVSLIMWPISSMMSR